jgi:hypothetical protein
MKTSVLILWIALLCSTLSFAQSEALTKRLEELGKERRFYQKMVAEANTKPHGLRLRATNETIVNHIVEHGYRAKVVALANQTVAVRDMDKPNTIVALLKKGEEVTVYERLGKNKFMIKTKNHQYGMVDKQAFGMALYEFPLEVLMKSDSPEERIKKSENGVIEQRMIVEFD